MNRRGLLKALVVGLLAPLVIRLPAWATPVTLPEELWLARILHQLRLTEMEIETELAETEIAPSVFKVPPRYDVKLVSGCFVSAGEIYTSHQMEF